jgi:hypothetical protein
MQPEYGDLAMQAFVDEGELEAKTPFKDKSQHPKHMK